MNLDSILSSEHLNACADKRQRYSSARAPTALDYAAVDDARDLFWLAGALRIDCKLVVLAACDCDRRTLPFWERYNPNDDRARRCIETVEAWCRGEATVEQVRTARDIADATPSYGAATYVAAAVAAANAADAATYAADAVAHVADDAAYTATYAADAAAYAAYAASAYAATYAAASAADAAAAYAAARTKALQDLCVVVRLRIPWPVIRTAAVARGLMKTQR